MLPHKIRISKNLLTNKPVSKRRDHKSVCASEVLVHVVEADISDGDKTLIRLLFEVESALFEPLEVTGRLNVESHQVIKDIFLMHVDGNEGFEFGSLHFCQLVSCLVNELV